MTYGRLSKPRFYMDVPNWRFSRGLSRNSAIKINVAGVAAALASGSTKYQMFDMNPVDQAVWSTDAGTDTASVRINLTTTNNPVNFIAILNHNLATAGGKFRVCHSASDIETAGGTDVSGLTEVFNGDVSGVYATPDTDGDTLLTFTQPSTSADQYLCVEFEDVSTWSDDLAVGQIIFGYYYTSPVSPDLPVRKITTHEGVKIDTSAGGRKFGKASWITANPGAYTTFRTNTSVIAAQRKMSGREAFDFSFPNVADTSIYPADRLTPYSAENFLYDVINKSAGNLIPFIFAADSTSTTQGDYLYGRFDSDTFESMRSSWKYEDYSLRVVQEF